MGFVGLVIASIVIVFFFRMFRYTRDESFAIATAWCVGGIVLMMFVGLVQDQPALSTVSWNIVAILYWILGLVVVFGYRQLRQR